MAWWPFPDSACSFPPLYAHAVLSARKCSPSPWPGGSFGWRIILYTKRFRVPSLVRAHTWVGGSIPSRDARGKQPLSLLSLKSSGWKEGGKEGGREGRREGRKEGGKEGGREGGKEGGKEGRKSLPHKIIQRAVANSYQVLTMCQALYQMLSLRQLIAAQRGGLFYSLILWMRKLR